VDPDSAAELAMPSTEVGDPVVDEACSEPSAPTTEPSDEPSLNVEDNPQPDATVVHAASADVTSPMQRPEDA